MLARYLLLLSFIALVVASQAHAYGIFSAGHRAITKRAVEEFGACFPEEKLTELQGSQVIRGSWREDVTARKYIAPAWNHFYHPHKTFTAHTLLGERKNSDDRVRVLRRAIQDLLARGGSERSIYMTVGRLVHHVQDMTSPAHVVLVKHPPSSFESGSHLVTRAPISCSRYLRDPIAHPEAIHRETALKTLAAVRSPIKALHNERECDRCTWEMFWRESESASGFGGYGVLGNRFGQTVITAEGGDVYRVEEGTYSDFMTSRLSDAVDGTVQVLRWVQRERTRMSRRGLKGPE